jgi:hypothetical protein
MVLVYRKVQGKANLPLNRASAFTFSASKISLTAACFEEKIYREVEEGERRKKKRT